MERFYRVGIAIMKVQIIYLGRKLATDEKNIVKITMLRLKNSKRFVASCIFLLYLVIVCAIGIEIGGRVFFSTDGEHLYLRKQQLFIFDPELGYALKVGFQVKGEDNRLYPGVDLHINSLGLRSSEVDSRPKIILVGDSVTFGYGIRSDRVVSSQLENLLGGKYQVINAGIPGYNFQQWQLMAERLATQLKPVFVVALVNANDLQPRYYPVMGGATVSRFRAYPWESELPEERELVSDPYKRWILEWLMTSAYKHFEFRRLDKTPARSEQNTEALYAEELRQISFYNSSIPAAVSRSKQAIASTNAFAARMQKKGIGLLFAFLPYRVAAVVPKSTKDARFSDWAANIPRSTRVGVVDLLPVLNKSSYFLVADDHPSEEGHRIIAGVIAKELSSLGINSSVVDERKASLSK